MCYARGSLYIVLVIESMFIGVLLPFLVYSGRLLTRVKDETDEEDPREQHNVGVFAALLVICVLQTGVVLCMSYALRQLRWGWLIPYWLWRTIQLLVAIVLIVVMFVKFEDFYEKVLRPLPTFSDKETAMELRNSLLVPVVVAHLVLGMWALLTSIRAGKILRSARSEAKMGKGFVGYPAGTIAMNGGGYAYGPYAMSQSSAYGYNYKY